MSESLGSGELSRSRRDTRRPLLALILWTPKYINSLLVYRVSRHRGVIIAWMDTGECSSEATKQDWEHLSADIIVRTDAGALVHFEDPLSRGLLSRDQDLGPPRAK
jgi:hypothetical protein